MEPRIYQSNTMVISMWDVSARFKKKLKLDGTIEKYKTWFVAKGYTFS
jgi:hypothetical protein